MKEFRQYSLLPHNTFGLDVRCRRFVEYAGVEELLALLPSIREDKYLHIGAGSNLLFTRNFDGTILHSDIRGRERVCDDGACVLLRVGAGENWDETVACCTAEKLYGLENLSLIPGEVGAAAIQNIGAYGSEVKDFIREVEVVEVETGKRRTLSNSDCAYAYRHSRFKDEWRGRFFVVSVTFQLSRRFVPQTAYGGLKAELERQQIEQPTAEDIRRIVMKLRRHKLPDPDVLGNAGSFFMNPVVSREKAEQLLHDHPSMPHYPQTNGAKLSAGWLIEQCGWKGRRLGRAGVYSQQALILVNQGGASPDEIVRLSDTIVADVEARFGVCLKPEVNRI